MSAELVSVDEMRTEQLPNDWQPPALGSWWWCTHEVSGYEDDDDDDDDDDVIDEEES